MTATYAIAALLGCGLVWLSVLSWRDYMKWRYPEGAKSKYGQLSDDQTYDLRRRYP